MSQEAPAATATPSKKQVRKEIVEKLTGALADYKQELGEKKLATYVKKASKLISRDLKKSGKKHKVNKEGKSKKGNSGKKTSPKSSTKQSA